MFRLETPEPLGQVIKVVCAADLDEPGRARLDAVSAAARIEHVEPRVVPELEDAELEVLIAGDVPRSAPRLRWLQAPTAGVERLVGRIPAGIVLTNARGVYAPAMAEYVIWAVLQATQGAEARRRLQQARRWPDDEKPVLGRRLRGLTMLVAGYGGVGREVARLAKAIGMRVVAIKARPEVTRYDGFLVAGTGDPEGVIPERILGVDQLAEAAGTADFLVLTMPATSRNRGMVGPEVLAALPAGAWVVNVGRGTVLDQPALVEALRSDHLGGAVLDVVDQEPLSRQSPLWKLPNVVLTPHVSGADALGRTELAALVCANLRHYMAGEPMLNLVDLGRGY